MRKGNVLERGTESAILPKALFALFTCFFFHENKRSAKNEMF